MEQDKDFFRFLFFNSNGIGVNNSLLKQGHKSKQEMLQNILVTFVILSGNFLQGECTVDLFKIPDPNKPCHLEIVKSRNNDTDHSGSRVIDTDVKSQLISTHFFNHQSCR